MPPISGDTLLYGLLSQGAKYTLSPAMHNRAAKILGKDLLYAHFDLKAERVKDFLLLFWHMNGQGLNVTMPHKNLVASLVKTEGLESVNTLVRSPLGWTGYSTDGDGFLLGLHKAHANISDFDAVIILGSGGAAQSILRSIALTTAERPLMTIIHRRSKAADQKLRNAISVAPVQMLTLRSMDETSFIDTMKESLGLKRLIIQATSAPKHGNTLPGYVPALDFMTTEDLLVDLIYDQPSELYSVATQRGLPTQDGLPMLIEQARLSQKLWWGESVTYEDLERAIEEA